VGELQNFGKYRVTGPHAGAWLDRIMAGRVPPPGRVSLSPMLSPAGRIIGDFTITCMGAEDYHLTASYRAQAYHMRWFEQHGTDGVTVENLSDTVTGFQIAGPRARDVLEAARGAPVDLRFLQAACMRIGMAPCRVQRLSYTGDLGFEIYTEARFQRHLWDVLWAAGQPFGLAPFGMRAMMSLRLDRGFGAWMAEYSPDYTPAETGLDRFMKGPEGADFIGKEAFLSSRATRRLVTFEVDAGDADVQGYEPIWHAGGVVGFCTSGGYSHHMGRSIAIGFLPLDLLGTTDPLEIEILGERRAARILTEMPFDPTGARMRA
jgi:dimethylglycine dehydrogenase